MTSTPDTPFVLDLEANPHPQLLAFALQARANARVAEDRRGPLRESEIDWRQAWRFYLRAMVDATGCDPAEFDTWLDRHQPRS